MTYVVTDNCIKCKYTDCVDVCPVDCFHEGPNFLVIDPDELAKYDDFVADWMAKGGRELADAINRWYQSR